MEEKKLCLLSTSTQALQFLDWVISKFNVVKGEKIMRKVKSIQKDVAENG